MPEAEMNLNRPGEAPLESWKDIAAYLNRNAVTVRRWEKEEGLPIHRHTHRSRSSVYAYASEIDSWRATRKLAVEPRQAVPSWRRFLTPSFALTMMLSLIMVGNGIRPVSAQQAGTAVATRQAWTGPRVDATGTVSADGQFLSFTDWSTGDLALHDLETGQDRRLTSKGTWEESGEFAEMSVISRDGKQVAYGWQLVDPSYGKGSFSELRIIDRDGGKPRVLVPPNPQVEWIVPLDWSPDGKWIAVVLQRTDGEGQIALTAATNGAQRILKSTGRQNGAPPRVVFSPDSRFVAYDVPAKNTPDRHAVYIMSLNNQGEVPAVGHADDDRVIGWSPDGKRLLITSARGGAHGVWAVPVGEGRPQGEPELLKSNFTGNPVGLTRSGALFYSVGAAGRDIYLASMDFVADKTIATAAILPQPYVGLNDFPQWSRDGKYLAYLVQRDRNSSNGQLTTLAIRSMETGVVRELRPNLGQLNEAISFWKDRPLWSPDGGSLLINGVDRQNRAGIYRVDARNGEAVPLILSDSGGYGPAARAWSPDGRTLFVGRIDPKSRQQAIFARDLQTGTEREIVRRSYLGDVVASPDGRFLAVIVGDTQSKLASLIVLPMEGGRPRELVKVSDPEALGAFLAWTSDGKSLLFRKFSSGSTLRPVWTVPVEGGSPRQLDQVTVGRNPSVHPDGRQIAFTSGDPQLEIWAMENFLSAKSRN